MILFFTCVFIGIVTYSVESFVTGSHLYVSAEGEFEVLVGNEKVFSFGPGRAFGELAILYNTKRNATIRGKVVASSTRWCS
jgi:cGMP-dependent protein kinase